MRPDPKTFLEELRSAFGSLDRVFETQDRELAEFERAWNRDTETIERVLRAHLVVEHFVTHYLEAKSPELASLERARLAFAQKVALIGNAEPILLDLIPGLRALGQLRNHLAHRLSAELDPTAVATIQNLPLFRAMEEERVRRFGLSRDTPIDIVEAFARYAGGLFQSLASDDAALWRQAVVRSSERANGED